MQQNGKWNEQFCWHTDFFVKWFDVCIISLYCFMYKKKSVHFTSYLLKVRKKILNSLLCIGGLLNVNIQIFRFWNKHFLINVRCLSCFLCDPYVMVKVKRLTILGFELRLLPKSSASLIMIVYIVWPIFLNSIRE